MFTAYAVWSTWRAAIQLLPLVAGIIKSTACSVHVTPSTTWEGDWRLQMCICVKQWLWLTSTGSLFISQTTLFFSWRDSPVRQKRNPGQNKKPQVLHWRISSSTLKALVETIAEVFWSLFGVQYSLPLSTQWHTTLQNWHQAESSVLPWRTITHRQNVEAKGKMKRENTLFNLSVTRLTVPPEQQIIRAMLSIMLSLHTHIHTHACIHMEAAHSAQRMMWCLATEQNRRGSRAESWNEQYLK